MLNLVLYRREIKSIWKMLAVFAGILTMYIAVVISIYDSEMLGAFDIFTDMMPALADAMGFKTIDTSLLGFLSTYLYGFILAVCPMIFSILCGHTLIAQHVDKGSMVSLLAAPVKRYAVAFTQMKVLATGIMALVVYATILKIVVCEIAFPGELDAAKLLWMNVGLLGLHLFIGGICFFFSCLFSEAKYSLGFGAGIPFAMFVLQMLGNVGGGIGAGAESIKYFTFFTLFDPMGLATGESSAIVGMLVLFAGAVLLFAGAITVFSRKDLHI